MAQVNNFDERALLPKFKLSIGDLTPASVTDLNDYYIGFLQSAAALLLSNDISESVLGSELGQNAIVFYAKCLKDGIDVATNPTCELLRNTLSAQTKGERYADGN